MKYIVNASGGLTSYKALERTIEQYGKEDTIAVFGDVKIEHATTYQFLDDQERHFGITIHRVADGRTPFQVWRDSRAITLPNGAAPCSQKLKRDPINVWTDARGWQRIFGPLQYAHEYAQRDAPYDEPYTIVMGMDWSELDRMQRAEARYAPIPVWFPLTEPPYLDKCHIADELARKGIAVPQLYLEGFSHNNCGGGCVKAGQAHWAHLYHTHPDTYARWESEEAAFMEHIGKKRTILKDRRGGKAISMSLAEFRGRLERGEAYDEDEWGGCGCFAPVVQGRFDDLLLEAV